MDSSWSAHGHLLIIFSHGREGESYAPSILEFYAPVFLPGESHGQRSLVSYTTRRTRLSNFTFTFIVERIWGRNAGEMPVKTPIESVFDSCWPLGAKMQNQQWFGFISGWHSCLLSFRECSILRGEDASQESPGGQRHFHLMFQQWENLGTLTA